MTKEDWAKIEDLEMESVPAVTFTTPSGNEVEFVKVMRCKDCKWFDIDGIHGRPLDGHEVCTCKKFYGYPMRDDEYCSRAERRENE